MVPVLIEYKSIDNQGITRVLLPKDGKWSKSNSSGYSYVAEFTPLQGPARLQLVFNKQNISLKSIQMIKHSETQLVKTKENNPLALLTSN